MFSLLNNTIRWYIVIGVFLYVILFAYYGNDCISWYNALNIYMFASYALILWKSNKLADANFTSKNLGIIVFAYSFVFVTLSLLLSDYYSDNSFIFSDSDAIAYYKYSSALLGKSHEKWIPFLLDKRWFYDDWGAPIAYTLMFHIVHSKLFVNFCYVLLNTISSICLFKIGRVIMHVRYAYIAALSFAISSYSIFFMGSFLKEEMLVFLVVASMYMLYMYIQHNNMGYLFIGGFISLAVIFFRPPVALFIWVSYMIFFLLKAKKGIFRSLAIFVTILAAVAAFGIIQFSAERYAHSGDVTETEVFVSTSAFQKIVLYAGALVGPFPQLLQYDDNFTYKPLFGAGLLFKLLLPLAFWTGFWKSVRHKYTAVIPLYAFVILEILGLSVALDGLELRKSMPHVPLYILTAFWLLSMNDMDMEKGGTSHSHDIWVTRQFAIVVCVAFGAALVWNIWKQ